MQKNTSTGKKIAHFLMDIVETIVVASAIFVIIYMFLVQPHQVNGNSMWPNFFSGEYLLTDKISYRFGTPQRGDVIIFHAPPEANCPQQLQCDFVKRIIGLPNEMVEIKDGELFIDNAKINEPYLKEAENQLSLRHMGNLTVELESDEYFVMGDNRSHSSDSRSWGPVKRGEIVGKAWFRYWPPQRMGLIAVAAN